MFYYISMKDDFEIEIVKKIIKEFDKNAKITIDKDTIENEDEVIKKANCIICDNQKEKIKKIVKYNKNMIIYIPHKKTPTSLLKNKKIYTYKRKNELREILAFLLKRKKTQQMIKMITIMTILVIALLSTILIIRKNIVNNNNKKLAEQEQKEKELKEQEQKEKEIEEQENAIKRENVIFLGDSITYQYDLDEFYPEIPHIRSGVEGYCTDDILDHLEDFVYIYNPTKVVLLIGTNDIRLKDYSNQKIVDQINEIVDKIKENRPKAEIYVESIYPINKESNDKKIDLYMVGTRENKRIMKINKLIQKMCEKEKVTYINMYDELTDEDGNLNIDYTREGLHLIDEGYEVVTNKIKEELNIKEENKE